jgi:hypothetical protein
MSAVLCSRCSQWVDRTELTRDASVGSGRKTWCRKCDRERSRGYYERAGREKGAARYQANREEILAQAAARTAERRGGPRKCKRCGKPSISSRHAYCRPCRERAEDRRAGRKRRPSSAARERLRQKERERPSPRQRGYDHRHKKRRQELAPLVAAGNAVCARCGRGIASGEKWDLGHSDFDRTAYVGPEHARCNRATATHRKGRRQSRRW